MSVFVIVPTYNESENLPSLLQKIDAAVPGVNILVVDDCSPDNTGILAESLRAQYVGRLHVLHRPKKQGLGRAYIAGFKYAMQMGATKLIQMDADHSHPVDALNRMLTLSERYDLVIGSRYVAGGDSPGLKGIRKLVSRFGGLYSRTILGLRVQDMTSGFKCFDVKVLRELNLDSFRMGGFGFQIELIYKTFLKGFSIKEMPIIFQDRVLGDSKMDFRIFFEALFNVFELKRHYKTQFDF